MNTEKTYLQRRIEFIQDILDNPSQLDVPHPKGYSWPAYSISKEDIEHLKLDNTISSHLLTQQINPNKLLFKAHQFQKHETTLIDFEYDGCSVDYCFVHYKNGLQQPFAIGIELDEPFDGWWARHPKIEFPINTNPLIHIPLFFVTQKQIFDQTNGFNSVVPLANKMGSIAQFTAWLKKTEHSAIAFLNGQNGLYEFEGEHPLHKHLKSFS